MTAALDPLPGDPLALAASAGRLGRVASAVRGEQAAYAEGARTATLAVWRSDAAFRVSALHDGLRGVDAEYSRVERAGVRAAGLLEEHARAWRRVEDELDDLRALVARVEAAAPAHGGERARRTREDAEARAREVKRALLEQRAALVGEIRGLVTGYDPAWTEVPASAIRHAALASPMGVLARRMASGTLTTDEAWSAMADAHAEVAGADSRAWRSSATYQVLGGLDELQQLLVGSVTETGEAVAHPVDALEGAWRLLASFATHPVRTSTTLWHAGVDPFAEDWHDGERGRAVGRGLGVAFELALGTKGLRTVRDGDALPRMAEAATALRQLREAAALRRAGTRLPGSSTWAFGSERLAARAVQHPVPGSTYRVRHEGLPTDYVFGPAGELVVVRGPGALLRRDVPVPPPDAFAAWHHISRHRGSAPPLLKGNGVYKNEPTKKGEARFPAYDAEGKPIGYREYDIVKKDSGKPRPPDRLLRGSDGSLWFSDDHYVTAVRIR